MGYSIITKGRHEDDNETNSYRHDAAHAVRHNGHSSVGNDGQSGDGLRD